MGFDGMTAVVGAWRNYMIRISASVFILFLMMNPNIASAQDSCSADDQAKAKLDIDWVLDKDAAALTCATDEVHHVTLAIQAIKDCNKNADGGRLDRCGPWVCNYLISRHWTPACKQ
jgi:hypothetical protein